METATSGAVAPLYDGAKIAAGMIDEGWHVRPTWRPDRKEYAEGCGPRQRTKKEIDASLFEDGRGVKLMGGTHRNGVFLAIIDDDSGGVIKARLDALGYRFLWAVSTHGDGFHGFAWFDLRVEGAPLVCRDTGANLGELKTDGDGVAYNPARFVDHPFPVRYPRELPRFNPAQCSAILGAIGYTPKPAPVETPAQVETAATTGSIDYTTNERDGIEVYNSENDVRSFLSAIGAAQSATRDDMYHCPCGLHKHSRGRGKLEAKPSLQVKPSTRPGNGAYIVMVSSPSCLFHEYSRNGVINAFDMRRAWEGITDKKEALKQFNPKPDWKPAGGTSATKSTSATPVAAPVVEPAAPATEDNFNLGVHPHRNAENAAFNADTVRAALEADTRFNRCPAYRDVGLYMLEHGGATFTSTKARIAQALDLGYEKVVQRAWNKLRDLGYGNRKGGGVAGYGGRMENEAATWVWANVPAPALEAPALQVSTPHDEVSTPDVLTLVSTLTDMPQSGEVSPITTEYIYITHDPNNSREKERDTSAVDMQVSTEEGSAPGVLSFPYCCPADVSIVDTDTIAAPSQVDEVAEAAPVEAPAPYVHRPRIIGFSTRGEEQVKAFKQQIATSVAPPPADAAQLRMEIAPSDPELLELFYVLERATMPEGDDLATMPLLKRREYATVGD